MQLHLDPRNFRFTTPIRQYAVRKMTELKDLADIIAAHVVLSHNAGETPDKRYTVKAHLAVAGPDIHAEDTSNDLYQALNRVSGRLARQLRKRHTALIDRHRQQAQRNAEQEKRLGSA